MFSFVAPEDAVDEHERLLANEEEILTALGIPYRVVNIGVAELGSSAAKKYDCEAWLPGQQRYRELTSTSNTTDFQARRLNIRYRPERRRPAPRRDAERHRGRGRPHADRDHRERPARRRLGRGPRGPARVGCAGRAAGRRRVMAETPITPDDPDIPDDAAAARRRRAGDRRPAARRAGRPRRRRRAAARLPGVRAAAGRLAERRGEHVAPAITRRAPSTATAPASARRRRQRRLRRCSVLA